MARNINVFWDTSDELGKPEPETVGLPVVVLVPDHLDEEEISDWLSDKWGYCHFGWIDLEKYDE